VSEIGRAAAERFRRPVLHRRIANAPAVGALARRITRFGQLTGRSLSVRASDAVFDSRDAGELPTSVPRGELWLPVVQRYHALRRAAMAEHDGARDDVAGADEGAPRQFVPAPLGPRGLPRATDRARRSPAGEDTGPAAGVHRHVSDVAPVAVPADVKAVGPVLFARERSRVLGRNEPGAAPPPASASASTPPSSAAPAPGSSPPGPSSPSSSSSRQARGAMPSRQPVTSSPPSSSPSSAQPPAEPGRDAAPRASAAVRPSMFAGAVRRVVRSVLDAVPPVLSRTAGSPALRLASSGGGSTPGGAVTTPAGAHVVPTAFPSSVAAVPSPLARGAAPTPVATSMPTTPMPTTPMPTSPARTTPAPIATPTTTSLPATASPPATATATAIATADAPTDVAPGVPAPAALARALVARAAADVRPVRPLDRGLAPVAPGAARMARRTVAPPAAGARHASAATLVAPSTLAPAALAAARSSLAATAGDTTTAEATTGDTAISGTPTTVPGTPSVATLARQVSEARTAATGDAAGGTIAIPPGVTATGARFLTELRRQPVDPVAPLPRQYSPLVRAVAGDRPVGVRSGPATTRALAAVGKQAATVDNVIHLAAAPATRPPAPEIVAHELVHAARPSPVPRFFDDDHHSEEEALARSTGRLLRAVAAPTDVAPATIDLVGRAAGAGTTAAPSVAHMPVGAGTGLLTALGTSGARAAGGAVSTTIRRTPSTDADVLRRRPAPPSTASSTSTVTSGDGGNGGNAGSPLATAATSVQDAAPSTPAPTLSVVPAFGGAADAPDSTTSVLRRFSESLDTDSFESTRFQSLLSSMIDPAPSFAPPNVGGSTAPSQNELVERIIDAIEQRVVDELERRGRRHHPGVF